MLERLKVVPPLGAMGFSAEFKTKVDQRRLEGTGATGWVGFLCPRNLLVPVIPGGVGADVVFHSLVLLRSWV